MENDDGQFGTGFFCKIHYENFDKKVLITPSSYQLNEKIRNLDKIPLKISLKDLNINTLNKIIFTDNEITFIEIKDNDDGTMTIEIKNFTRIISR